VDVSLIRPAELSSSDIEAWHSMQLNNSFLVNPFLCPEFAMGIGSLRTAARVAVAMDGSRIVGFFPFERRSFGAGVAIGAGLSNCQGLIYDSESDWDARELLKSCKLSTWHFDNLAQEQKHFEAYAEGHFSTAVIDLTDGFDAYQESFRLRSPKSYKNLKRKMTCIERDFGKLRSVINSRDVGELRILMSWKSEQCRRNGWPDIFGRQWVVELTDSFLGTQSEQFSGMLSMLYAGETPIAGTFDLRSRHYLAGWFAAYNPEFAKYSPGFMSHILTLEQLAADGIKTYDTSGTAPYQMQLRNGDVSYTRGTVSVGLLAAGTYSARVRSSEWARRQVKRSPFVYRVADRTLQSLGRIQ
jgi:CelD/BcsL family acetyltransferase involved in cellulose biosynthesis